ncbi:MAG: hypothetical protein HON90_17225 [Halobacteriovoraceae bacterium]|nr:hypothetical protein [Halobacteriovoraceae bacterium]
MGINSLIIFIYFILLSPLSFGAACCGGGSSVANLIVGDYRTQLSFGYTNMAITHTVNTDGEFIERDKNNQEVLETMTAMASYLAADYWQFGFSIPMHKNTHKTDYKTSNEMGVGDIKLQPAFEFMPELYYSKWKPRGFVFLQHNIINSRSVYNTKSEFATDAFSQGFNTTTLGLYFTKIIGNFDLTVSTEVHTSPARKFKSNGNEFWVTPRDGNSTQLTIGFSPQASNFHFGTNLKSSYDGAKKISGDIESLGTSKSYTEAGLSIGLRVADKSYNVSYTDQTFFGVAKNMNAAKIISFNLIHFLDL